ncbi:hypothetical protein Droror1_Dr00002375 [Drosera rotundifolia]
MIEMLDTYVEDAIESNNWIDSLSVLPSSFGPQDAFKVLTLCPAVQSAFKSHRGIILGEQSRIIEYLLMESLKEQLYGIMQVTNLISQALLFLTRAFYQLKHQ